VIEPGPGPGPPESPALERSTVEELRRLQEAYDSPRFLAQLLQIFTGNAPLRMAAIRDAIGASDARALERAAHTLKTNCGMLGASRMAALCLELERLGERGALGEAREALGAAEAEFSRVMEAVTALASLEPSCDPNDPA
jgi:two-component system sensor histidine kinase/response regulator